MSLFKNKSYFNYTEEATALNRVASVFIRNFIQDSLRKYPDASLYELEVILLGAVTMEFSHARIIHNSKAYETLGGATVEELKAEWENALIKEEVGEDITNSDKIILVKRRWGFSLKEAKDKLEVNSWALKGITRTWEEGGDS